MADFLPENVRSSASVLRASTDLPLAVWSTDLVDGRWQRSNRVLYSAWVYSPASEIADVKA